MIIGLVSLGCAKNAVDLQVMAGHLIKAGHTLAPSSDEADVIIVNTCAFIESAREEAVDEILRACELKKEGKCRFVIVGGCLAQRYGRGVLEVCPDVDAVFGIDGIDDVDSILNELEEMSEAGLCDFGGGLCATHGEEPVRVFDPPMPALRFTGKAFAYLKIAEGCAHRCAYCAIPGIRGNYRSRKSTAIVNEAKELLATGVKELNVIAQDPMLYGVDFKPGKNGKKENLVSLLRKLDKLPGDFWIRVLYSYPSEITDEYLEWLATSPHAVKYVDVPLQHTDPTVLKAMARGSAVKASLEAAERIRAAVPGVTLRTTLMTGFPGETAEAFKKMLKDVKEMQFDHLGVFAYSPEEDTPAEKMKGCPSAKVAAQRAEKVMIEQRKVWETRAAAYVGNTFRALVVAPGVARIAAQAPDVDGVVRLKKAPRKVLPQVGEFIDVKITSVIDYDFEGIQQ